MKLKLNIGSVLCLCTPVSLSVSEMQGIMSLEASFCEDVPLLEFMHLEFTGVPGESYRRRFGSLLLFLYYVFRALINSLVC